MKRLQKAESKKWRKEKRWEDGNVDKGVSFKALLRSFLQQCHNQAARL